MLVGAACVVRHIRHFHVLVVARGAGRLAHFDRQVQAVDLHLRYRLPAIGEPALHQRDLIRLGVDDASGQGLDRRAGAVRGGELRHDQGLRVMRDHTGHERDVRLGEPHAGAVLAGPVKGFDLGVRETGRHGAGFLRVSSVGRCRHCRREYEQSRCRAANMRCRHSFKLSLYGLGADEPRASDQDRIPRTSVECFIGFHRADLGDGQRSPSIARLRPEGRGSTRSGSGTGAATAPGSRREDR